MGGTQFNKRNTLNALTTAYDTLQYIKPVQLIVVWWMDIYSVHVWWHFEAGSFTINICAIRS